MTICTGYIKGARLGGLDWGAGDVVFILFDSHIFGCTCGEGGGGAIEVDPGSGTEYG
jgi:hypothetical protein